MRLNKFIVLLATLFLNTNLFGIENSKVESSEYQESIQLVEDLVSYYSDELRSCPGTKLVISCGNSICEPHKNEDSKNCAVDCLENVSIKSYNGQTLCNEYIQTQVPESIEEIQDIIKRAKFLGEKVRPIGSRHSATDTICSRGMALPLEKFNSVIGITSINGKDVVETETGVTVYQLSEWLHERGYAIGGLPHMGFRDVSIGGAMATGSHGSSPSKSAVISNLVEAIEVVDGNGTLRYFERHNTDEDTFKALSASLGLLGVVTKVKLEIQPQFNLEVSVTYHKDKELFADDLENMDDIVEGCEYGQLNWFPGTKRFVKTCGVRTKKLADDGANNILLQPKIPNFMVKPYKKILQYSACSNTLMCALEGFRFAQFKFQPPFVKNNKSGNPKPSKKVIGPSHRMISSHLTEHQDGFFQMDWEIAVPRSRAKEAFLAIKELVNEYRICLPLVGVFVRFAPSEDKTLLAHTTSSGGDWIDGEPAVYIEMPVYLPAGFDAQMKAEYDEAYEEFARILIQDYSGRPHWGKNREWTFDLIRDENGYDDRLDRFKSILVDFDPNGVFNNKFGKRLGLSLEK